MPAEVLQSNTRQSNLASKVAGYRKEMEAAKSCVDSRYAPQSFPWYAYDILSNVDRLDLLLNQAGLKLADLMGGNPALDIGCADGQLSFFMESLGYQVTAVDYPSTNANGMRAVRELKETLKSSVNILESDIDQGFHPPADSNYSLVFLLGILYHLKNPFLILETLAQHADYCFLSTRVSRFAADRTTQIHNIPMAYLLDQAETNNDITNYWIFSQAGLKRIIKRTGWDICGYLDVGNTVNSDPVTSEGDERVFCLLRRDNYFTNGQLLEGWAEPVGPRNGWRWAMETFSVRFERTALSGLGPVELEIYLPPEQLQGDRPVTLTVSSEAMEIAKQTFGTPGTHVMKFSIPARLADAVSIALSFHVAPKFPVTNHDPRPLGVIVNRIKSVFG